MTQTLTTDELRQIVDSHEKGYGMSVPINYGYLAARELLANREAQPVAEVFIRGHLATVLTDDELPIGTKLYTAPPAPAVVNGRTAEGWMAEALLQKKIADGLRKSAPVAPKAISTRHAIANMESHEPCDSINVAYKHGWNACRAAMLAQPVSQGYKLPDGGWISCSDLLPESGQNVITLNNCGGVFGGYVFKKYTDGSYVFVDAEEEYREDDTITHWMPLPAAPEGGNDA